MLRGGTGYRNSSFWFCAQAHASPQAQLVQVQGLQLQAASLQVSIVGSRWVEDSSRDVL